jgi:hypothetical protein
VKAQTPQEKREEEGSLPFFERWCMIVANEKPAHPRNHKAKVSKAVCAVNAGMA